MLKLTFEKIVDSDGRRLYQLTGYEGMKRGDMPPSYMTGTPRVVPFCNGRGVSFLKDIRKPGGDWIGYYQIDFGGLISEAAFAEVCEIAALAGERLAAIRRKLREERAVWHGTVEVLV